MEKIFEFNQSRKRSTYFQEFPIILNTFQSKKLTKYISPRNQLKKPLISYHCGRLSDVTLPKISIIQEFSTQPALKKRSLHFYIQGNRKNHKEKYCNFDFLPGTTRKTTKKIMKSEAMGTDLFDDSDISESYRRQDENSL